MVEVFIVAAARTPIGSFLGKLAPLAAPRLGAAAIGAALQRAGAAAGCPDQVIMGNVLQAGVGQAPARQASLFAEVPQQVGCTTVNKICGSGLRAVMDAANGIVAGEWHRVVAGGMESMSNAPYLLEKLRQGSRMGDVPLGDAMLKDGLVDAYSQRPMGLCAELCAQKYALGRAAQDAVALRSYQRARAAQDGGLFAPEICPVSVPQRRGDAAQVDADEEPHAAPLEKLTTLRPAFSPKDGSITAGNASKLSDGAAALLLMSEAQATRRGLRPLARLVAYASHAEAPEWFTVAPVGAIRKACEKAGLTPQQIDWWEINEAFAVVPMAATQQLDLDEAVVNPRGGAMALGHPLGASGARLLTTLVHGLQQSGRRYGAAALCIGGGEAVAMVVENLTK